MLDASRIALDLPALDHGAVQAAFKVAIISGKAHRAHMGRDVYGSSNKGLWDLVCATSASPSPTGSARRSARTRW
jgi:hypothetical protein